MPSLPLRNDEIDGLEEIEGVELRLPESVVISVRLNREELDEFSERAKEAGMKLSTFIKEAAHEGIVARAARNTGVVFGMTGQSALWLSGVVGRNSAGVGSGSESSLDSEIEQLPASA